MKDEKMKTRKQERMICRIKEANIEKQKNGFKFLLKTLYRKKLLNYGKCIRVNGLCCFPKNWKSTIRAAKKPKKICGFDVYTISGPDMLALTRARGYTNECEMTKHSLVLVPTLDRKYPDLTKEMRIEIEMDYFKNDIRPRYEPAE